MNIRLIAFFASLVVLGTGVVFPNVFVMLAGLIVLCSCLAFDFVDNKEKKNLVELVNLLKKSQSDIIEIRTELNRLHNLFGP